MTVCTPAQDPLLEPGFTGEIQKRLLLLFAEPRSHCRVLCGWNRVAYVRRS
jgi:hypothetical protein